MTAGEEDKGRERERKDVTGGETQVERKCKGRMESTVKRERKEAADTNPAPPPPRGEWELIDGSGVALPEGRWVDSPRWREQNR